MIDEPFPDDSQHSGLDARTVQALTALLAIDSAAAGRVCERSPSRRRARPQYGPRLDLGDDSVTDDDDGSAADS